MTVEVKQDTAPSPKSSSGAVNGGNDGGVPSESTIQPADDNSHGNVDVDDVVNGNDVQNSFSADSPYFSSYIDNEMKQMELMNDTLKDIAARTKTMGKCGALMSESTRRLALACRLRRPYTVEDERDAAEQERQQELDVAARRRAVGEEMASLLGVMSEVRCVTESRTMDADDVVFW
jgi:hypothetical protein